ncbi:MAG: NEW3 domain-containing protein, partial [Nanoarchaeota archaeon]
TTTPSSEDDLDPGINITVIGNVTDNTTNLDTVILQYKLTTDTTYTNFTMVYNITSGFFNAWFNATTAGTYNLRMLANDSAGNYNYTEDVNITVQYDRTWTRTPSIFTTISAASNQNVTIGNLTINNTGDYEMIFNISSNSTTTIYNQTSQFNLSAKESITIQINETAPTNGTKTIKLNTTSSPNGDPISQTTTGSIVVAPGQPILVATITTPSTESRTVTQGDTGVAFTANIQNVGEADASNVTFFFTFPNDWTVTFGSTSVHYNTLSSGATEENTIEVTIPSTASTGIKNFTANATAYNSSGGNLDAVGLIFSDSVTVTVNAVSQPLAPGTGDTGDTGGAATGGASGGGGGGGGGGGAPSLSKKIVGKELIESEEAFELVRGLSDSFILRVTNVYEEVEMYDVMIDVEGYLSQYLSISPIRITRILPGQTKEFIVTVTSPSYMNKGNYPLEFTITADLRGQKITMLPGGSTVTSFIEKALTEKRFVTLNILEVSRSDAEFNLKEAETNLADMDHAEFPTNNAARLLEDAKKALEDKNYEEAKRLSDLIAKLHEDAFAADDLINEVKEKIRQAEENGIDVSEAKSMLNLAIAAFERGDFEAALTRAKDAQLTELLLSKGKINYLKLIKQYWWAVLIAAMALLFAAVLVYRRFIIILIKRRLEDIDKEESTLHNLIRELQEKRYNTNKMSSAEYHRQMFNHETRLTDIRKLRLSLISKREKLTDAADEIKRLHAEDDELIRKIRLLQTNYYIKKKITTKTYSARLEEFKSRRTDIENNVAVLEAKLGKKEKVREQFRKRTEKEKEMIIDWIHNSSNFISSLLFRKGSGSAAQKRQSHKRPIAVKRLLNKGMLFVAIPLFTLSSAIGLLYLVYERIIDLVPLLSIFINILLGISLLSVIMSLGVLVKVPLRIIKERLSKIDIKPEPTNATKIDIWSKQDSWFKTIKQDMNKISTSMKNKLNTLKGLPDLKILTRSALVFSSIAVISAIAYIIYQSNRSSTLSKIGDGLLSPPSINEGMMIIFILLFALMAVLFLLNIYDRDKGKKIIINLNSDRFKRLFKRKKQSTKKQIGHIGSKLNESTKEHLRIHPIFKELDNRIKEKVKQEKQPKKSSFLDSFPKKQKISQALLDEIESKVQESEKEYHNAQDIFEELDREINKKSETHEEVTKPTQEIEQTLPRIKEDRYYTDIKGYAEQPTIKEKETSLTQKQIAEVESKLEESVKKHPSVEDLFKELDEKPRQKINPKFAWFQIKKSEKPSAKEQTGQIESKSNESPDKSSNQSSNHKSTVEHIFKKLGGIEQRKHDDQHTTINIEKPKQIEPINISTPRSTPRSSYNPAETQTNHTVGSLVEQTRIFARAKDKKAILRSLRDQHKIDELKSDSRLSDYKFGIKKPVIFEKKNPKRVLPGTRLDIRANTPHVDSTPQFGIKKPIKRDLLINNKPTTPIMHTSHRHDLQSLRRYHESKLAIYEADNHKPTPIHTTNESSNSHTHLDLRTLEKNDDLKTDHLHNKKIVPKIIPKSHSKKSILRNLKEVYEK